MTSDCATGRAPAVAGILETALVVERTDRAAAFYERILGLRPIVVTERLAGFDAGPGHVLLLFQRAGSMNDVHIKGGRIPGGFDSTGRSHMAFAIAKDLVEAWRLWLEQNAVTIESRVQWELGGESLYFRDPDGNLLELATPGTWPNY